jgi:hypothetical protein
MGTRGETVGKPSRKTLAALCCAVGVITPMTAWGQTITRLAGGAVRYDWDPKAVVTGENHVITSNPGVFDGPDVAPLIGATTFYSNGFTGAGTIVTNVEAGHVWNGHESLPHVTMRSNGAGVPAAPFVTPAFDRHATWVGMMIGGRQAAPFPGVYQQGIAFNTDLRSGAIATAWTGNAYATGFNTTASAIAFPYAAAGFGFGSADVINSSWGGASVSGSAEAGGADIRTTITDSLANGNRFTTFVVSAGNSGGTANPMVGAPGSGYNGITVAALANNGSNQYLAVASFSSRGPQDYRDPINGHILAATAQRAPVDIAAPGSQLTSAFYGGQTGGNDPSRPGSVNSPGIDFYSGNLQGTSFASPITAGGVALMHQAAASLGLSVNAEDTRIIKATMLNAATKIAGWNNAQVAHPNGNGGVRTTRALDFASGAGALDLARTYTQFTQGQADISGMTGGTTTQVIGWDYGSVNTGGQTDIVINKPVGGEFRGTVDWFRERTYIDPGTQVDVGFANINLEIWDSTFTKLYADSISTYNEVEHLSFNLPRTTRLGIRVKHAGNIFGAMPSEEFGLAWWGTANEWKNLSGNWTSSGNWTAAVIPALADDEALFGTLATTARTVTVDSAKVVGILTFDNGNKYTLGGGSTITMNNTIAANPAINVVNGSHDITAPLLFAKNTTVTVTPLASTLKATQLQNAASFSMTKAGAGTMEVNRLQLSGVTVSAGKVKVTPAGGLPAGTSRVGTVTITAGAKLDLSDNKLIVTSMPVGTWNGTAYTGVTGMIQSGFNGGDWNGSGIVTSMTDATTSVLTFLAVANADEVGYAGGTFGGVSVSASDTLVMYTWGGDADLNGTLNGDDYFFIDSNILAQIPGYHNGDFDVNGEINGDDYFIIDANISFAQASPPFPTGGGGGGLALVPEPGSMGFLAAAAGVGWWRRSRRRLR